MHRRSDKGNVVSIYIRIPTKLEQDTRQGVERDRTYRAVRARAAAAGERAMATVASVGATACGHAHERRNICCSRSAKEKSPLERTQRTS